METSYRERFTDPNEAARYDDLFTEASDTSYRFSVLWDFEKKLLTELVREFRRTHPRIDYLDFAAGTGRIVEHMEPEVDSATAIEISSGMLGVAKRRVKRANLICADITPADAPIEGQYDFITAFRFFLKAEPALRRDGMRALAARLKDETSWLVFNNHGNANLLSALRAPMQWARGKKADRMSDREVRQLAAEAGLKIERVIGYAQVPGKVARLVSTDAARSVEKSLSKSPLAPLGLYQCYVARLAGPRA